MVSYTFYCSYSEKTAKAKNVGKDDSTQINATIAWLGI